MKITESKFRSPSSNARYTKQLFWDMQREMPIAERLITPLYTLHEDVEGFINFRREYVNDMDPTGYKTATRLLENYEHWNILMRTKWFREAKEEWDKELKAKMEKEATDVLLGIMHDFEGSAKVSERIAAAKAVLGQSRAIGKNEAKETKRGRPTKEEVKGYLVQEAELTKEEQEDFERIRSIK